jgi:hypothetical protein
MNKGTRILLITCLLLSQVTLAQEKKPSYNGYSQAELKEALLILLDSGALVLSKDKGPTLDKNLIEELRKEGLIELSRPEVSSICTDIIN